MKRPAKKSEAAFLTKISLGIAAGVTALWLGDSSQFDRIRIGENQSESMSSAEISESELKDSQAEVAPVELKLRENPNRQPAQESEATKPKQKKTQNLQQFLKSGDLEKIRNESGEVISIMGEFPVSVGSFHEAQQFVSELAPNLQEEGLQLNPRSDKPQEGGVQTIYRFGILKGEYQIVDNFIDVFVSDESKAPYLVNQSVRKMTQLDNRLLISYCQAVEVIAKMGNKTPDCRQAVAPQVWLDATGQGQLSWAIYGSSTQAQNNESYIYYVSALDARILERRSTLFF